MIYIEVKLGYLNGHTWNAGFPTENVLAKVVGFATRPVGGGGCCCETTLSK